MMALVVPGRNSPETESLVGKYLQRQGGYNQMRRSESARGGVVGNHKTLKIERKNAMKFKKLLKVIPKEILFRITCDDRRDLTNGYALSNRPYYKELSECKVKQIILDNDGILSIELKGVRK